MTEPRQIGSYRVIRALGGGGMGMVYLVEDRDSGGQYALKLLSPSLSPTELEVKRFRREFLTMSRLRHPKIVEVYESGIHEASLYFVMEYVEGAHLREWFLPQVLEDQAPEELDEYVRSLNDSNRVEKIALTFSQICEALALIHGFNIVHRDLKPENILLTKNGAVKLLDFGIAKRLGGPESSQAKQIMGTFTYISPEQAQCGDVDGRSDLYALGVILYELLAGRPPFQSAEPVGRLFMHLNNECPAIREWNPFVDPLLESIVLKLLQKDPLERYQRAEDLQAALDGYLHGRETPSGGFWAGIQDSAESRMANPKFVGRAREREMLLRWMMDGGGSASQLLLLSGNAGMGKTRLAREVVSSARVQQVECFLVRCSPETPPYTAYQELMEQLRVGMNLRFHEQTKEWWGKAGEAWFRLVGDDGDFDESGEFDEGSLFDTMNSTSSGAEEEKFLLFEAARTILARSLERTSIVFFLDDIMHADEISLELTEYLVRALGQLQLPHKFLICGAFRNEDVGANHTLNQLMRNLASERLYTLLDLHPLAIGEVREMAESMVGLPPSEEALSLLMAHGQGIPFFVEELVKAWFEEQVYVDLGDSWTLLINELEEEDTSLAGGRLPPTILKRLGRRLERLSRSAREVAEWLAVLGQETAYDLLVSVLPLSENELLPCLDELLQHKLVLEDWSSGMERYKFSYPGIRDVIYGQIDALVRQHYHLSVAQALKRSSGREGLFELIAQHFVFADEEEQGAWYMLLAVEQQLRAFALRSAMELVQRCEALLSKTNDVLFQAGSSWWWRYHEAYLELLDWCGEYGRGLKLAGDALRQLEGEPEAATFLRWEASFFRQTGRYQEALDCVQRALVWNSDDDNGRMYLLQEAGRIYRAQGRYGAALEAFREAIAWAISLQKVTEQGRLSGMIGKVLYRRGDFVEARAHYLKFLDISVESGDRRGEVDAICKLGELELDEGDVQASLERFERAIALARELGERRMECTALALLGQLQLDRRLYEEAREKLEMALHLACQLGDQRTEGELLGRLGQACYMVGRNKAARMYLEEGVAKASEVGDRVAEIQNRCFLCVVGIAMQSRGHEEILVELDTLMEQSEQIESMEAILTGKLVHAHVYRLLGDRESAMDHLVAGHYLALEVGNRRMLARLERERYSLDGLHVYVWGHQKPGAGRAKR